MSGPRVQTRIDFLVVSESADQFQKALQQEVEQARLSHLGTFVRVGRPSVRGQSLEGVGPIASIVVAMGGEGIAAIIKAVAEGVVAFLKAGRGTVKVQRPDGTSVSLDGYTAKEVEHLLTALHGGER